MRRLFRWLTALGLLMHCHMGSAGTAPWPQLPPGLVESEITAAGQTVHLHQCVGPDALAQLVQQYAGVEQPCGPLRRARVGSGFREEADCRQAHGRRFVLRSDIEVQHAHALKVRTMGWQDGKRLLDVHQRLVHLGTCEHPDMGPAWGRAPRQDGVAGGGCGVACQPVLQSPAQPVQARRP